MKGNKIIATLVVLAMVLSTLVVLKQLNIINEASAYTPGVNKWGNATTDITYGVAYTNVYINTSKWTGTGPWYLYYPTYRCDGNGNAYRFTWDGPFKVNTGGSYYDVRVPNTIGNSVAIDTASAGITFNRSGMWIFDNIATTHYGNVTSSYAGFLWVNTSTAYSIDSVSDFEFGTSGYKTFTVNTGNDSYCMIDIMAPDNSTIYHKWRPATTGEMKISGNFTMAGEYTIKAYSDKDVQNQTYYYPDENGENYSYYYGNGATFPSAPKTHVQYYNYTNMGPWDPPEKNATEATFTVNTGEPTITLTNTTIYWGFKIRIDVNITDNDGIGIIASKTNLKLRHANTYFNYTDVWINSTGLGNYSIEIPRIPAVNWSNLGAQANGTWKVVFGYNKTGDATEEWNGSATFTVKSVNPPVQLVIVNDGSGTATDKKVDIPAYTSGDDQAPIITIQFDIFGTSISDAQGRAYYGDDNPPEDYKNITISGDILYPVDATTLTHGTLGRWTAAVTPTKPGGTITIAIDWPGDNNGTATQTIEIVNGTHVTSAVEKFTVGQHFNLTITVKDMDGDPVKNAQVWLIWEDGNGQFNSTNGTSKAGNGLNGEYTFWINPDDSTYPTTAPQNITVAARLYPTSAFWGYTKVVMERNHNMMINATPTMSYAGDPTTYNIDIALLEGGHPTKNSDLHIAIYNSTGDLVTGDDAWSKTNAYEINDEEIILSGGTFYLFAHNLTHDSEGNNATLLITSYTVVSSPSTLAWKIDESVNMTFQVTPAGNGTLTIENMSSLPNCSYLDQDTQIDIVNGVGTLDEVDATTLGNVTFAYTPENGGESRPVNGLLRITTATATPSPTTIYVGEATSVTITITHPATGAALQGVEVGLDWDLNSTTTILSKLPTNLFTDALGKVTFAITAEASGNVTIFVENETDPDNEFVIVATARKQMTISNDPSVDEGKTFTVEAKTNGVLITDATVTFTFNGQTWPTTTGVATITAPSVQTSLTYSITATTEGYASVSSTIMVLNVPKLIIAISGDVKAGQTFTLTIANDMGNPVIGATITFEGKTYTTGAGGVVTLTAPTTEGSYPVSATFPGFGSVSSTVTVVKGGGIPGFELLTLIAAIGVAFLLLRRRRN